MTTDTERRSIFARAAGTRAKWVVFSIWVVVIFIAAGPANLPGKFTDAEENESTSFLPGDAESTKALEAAEELQGGELAPAVIVYRRESGLTPADRQKIVEDVQRLTQERFPGVVADGPTAAAGGEEGGAPEGPAGAGAQAPEGGGQAGGQPEGCGGPTTPISGQPSDYRPFVGPLCSEDGKAAIVTAYLKGEGEGDRILDPIEDWRDKVSDPGGGLEVKITGGAGYAADAIDVFESINGTLLLAAVSLVIVLLILIYRSPIFLFIPLAAVMFAEVLARSIGYGITELGVTVNGQSSSIMSILVLGAGTDYALLIVARYREELHYTEDRHEAIRAAMTSAGPAVFASAATVIAALFCLSIAKVNGTSGMGPFGAMGIACAALSMLTLLPALLTIFGRRAFWPFVPHTPRWELAKELPAGGLGRRMVDGSTLGALLPVIGACLLVALLLPLVLLNKLVQGLVFLVTLGRVRVPSLIVGPLDRAIFKPYEVRRTKHEHMADATHGFWARVGDRVAQGPKRVLVGSIAVLLVLCAGFGFFSTDLTTNDSYRTEVESVEGQELLSQSFPSGASAPTDIIVSDPADVPAVTQAVERAEGVESVTGPVAQGEEGVLVQATLEPEPYSTEAFDLVEPIREAADRAAPNTLVGGATAVEFDVRDAAAWDSTVIPPIVLVVVMLILVLLLRSLLAPLLLVGTVILSFLAALGVGYFAFDVIFDFPGSDPSLPLFAFVFLVALGVDYNIFLVARAREETLKHGTREGMLRALAVTGGVITSAGIVLAGTFSVLAVLPLVFLTEIGFVVAFGVLLDTFLVRSVLVPALGVTLGKRFWWPSELSRTDGTGGPPGVPAQEGRRGPEPEPAKA
jgi:putative drug exporter of the RND superfamily